jgi:hypothetical protein
MKTTTTTSQLLSDTAAAFGDLIKQGTQLSLDLLQSLSGSSASAINQMMSPSLMGGLLPNMKAMMATVTDSSCKIPPPCWMPQAIGEVACHVCPGGTATVRLRIGNCGATRRDIAIEVAGKATAVTITPANLSLGPMEREFVTASVSVPAEAATGQEFEVLLWVRGCRDHYLRWSVKVATRGASCCHEVDVEDCPDPIHHWYDHFYCARPCSHSAVGTGTTHG